MLQVFEEDSFSISSNFRHGWLRVVRYPGCGDAATQFESGESATYGTYFLLDVLALLRCI